MPLILEHTVKDCEQGQTAEYLLKKHFGISSGLMCELKYSGRIFINSKICRTVDTVNSGDTVSADVEEIYESCGDIVPYETKLDVLYEDDYILAVNKPGYMESHPCHSNYKTTLANAVMYYWAKKGEYHKYHIVNRLDRGTSGICIIAKNRFAHGKLSEQMQNGAFKKYYTALVHGNPAPAEGVIELPISRSSDSIIKREVKSDGKYAKTVYQTIAGNGRYSLIDIQLETGRTHQIRVHFSHIGNPLVGDWLYGEGDGERKLIQRQALHSGKVEFNHPLSNKPMQFVVEVPDEIKNLLK